MTTSIGFSRLVAFGLALILSPVTAVRAQVSGTEGIITTVAGGGGGFGDGGPATAAQLYFATGVAVDGAGNVFIADTNNYKIRKVAPDGTITRVAGTGDSKFVGNDGDGGPATAAQIGLPDAVALDATGNLYVVGQNRIWKVIPDGTIHIVAGNGTVGSGGDGGPATDAQLHYPRGVAADGFGNLYIADTENHRIRKVTPDGMISTVAGTGIEGSGGDGGPATDAKLTDPNGVAVDGAGNIYIADAFAIGKVRPDGTITLVAGSITGEQGFGGDGGPATAALIQSPNDLTVDGAGNVYIADSWNDRIRKVTLDGIISTIAGTGETDRSGDGGPATDVRLNSPTGVDVDASGSIYFTEFAPQGFGRVRKVAPDGTITTVAGADIFAPGADTFGNLGDGGPATAAGLYGYGLASDAAGNLYIADSGNKRIRKVDPSGIITTAAGNGTLGSGGDGGPATAAQLSGPIDVAVDAAGSLFIADSGNNRIRKVAADGTITTLAGGDTDPSSVGDGGPASTAVVPVPQGVTFDAAANLYVATPYRIRKVGADGTITTVVGTGENGFGGDGGPATNAKLNFAVHVDVDASGNLYIADLGNHRIRRVAPDGIITTIAGTGEDGFDGDGGPATNAKLNSPQHVAVDTSGNLYIADSANHRIRRVAPDGIITTIAGTGEFGSDGDGGPATTARLNRPTGVAVDEFGNLYISGGSRVRKVSPSGTITTVAGGGFDQEDGALATGAFVIPRSLFLDDFGDLYFIDWGDRIRKITSDGVINTVAGNGTAGFSGDGGPATDAQLYLPAGIAVDAFGNIYIADSQNHRIRRVTPDGRILTAVGTGEASFTGDGGLATGARLSSPSGVAVDGFGNVYIAESRRIRKVMLDGTITTVVGGGAGGLIPDGGPATAGALSNPNDVVVDAFGNLYIADSGSSTRSVRKVGPDGTITTIAGTGEGGFNGDGIPATTARLNRPSGVALDTSGNLYIADQINGRIRKVTLTQPMTGPIPVPFSVVDRGAEAFETPGGDGTTVTGYGRVQPGLGSMAPSGVSIISSRQNGVLVSEAGVPASPAMTRGRVYAAMSDSSNVALVLNNAGDTTAAVSFFFTDPDGDDFGNDDLLIQAGEQVVAFLSDAPSNGRASFAGGLTFDSSIPVSVTSIQVQVNGRGESLLTPLPVSDLNNPPAPGAQSLPLFAANDGWSSKVVLLNPTDATLPGSVQFRSQGGGDAQVTVDGISGSNFAYSIPPRSSQVLAVADTSGPLTLGSASITPTAGIPPVGTTVVSFTNDGITVSETGVPAMAATNSFRLYSEVSGDFFAAAVGATDTVLLVANDSPGDASVTVEPFRLDGTAIGPTGTISIPQDGQTLNFLSQVPGLEALPTPFHGVLHVESASSVAVSGVRLRLNGRGDFLISGTPAIDASAPASSSEIYFPLFLDNGGWSTEFVVFSGGEAQASSGTLTFVGQTGQPFALELSE